MTTRRVGVIALFGLAWILQSSCGFGNLSNKAILSGKVRVILQLNPATPGTFASLDPSWTGNWTSDIPNPEPGLPVGSQQGSGSVSVAQASQTATIELPVVGNLRRGIWSFAITVSGDGTVFFTANCAGQEIPSDKTLRVAFTEGGPGCTTSVE